MKRYNFWLCVALFCFNKNIETASPPMFSLLNWNILGPQTLDAKDFFSLPPNHEYDRMQKVIQYIDNLNGSHPKPNILTLQEVDPTAQRILREGLRGLGYEEIVYQRRGRHTGVIIFALTSYFTKQHTVEVVLENTHARDRNGAAIIAILKSTRAESDIAVVCVHLSRGHSARPENIIQGKEQLEYLFKKIAETCPNLPTIIAGDFNIDQVEMQQQALPWIHTIVPNVTYVDALKDVGVTATKVGGADPVAIDHILYTQERLQLDARKTKLGADNPQALIYDQVPSDHRPEYVVFFLPATTQAGIAPHQARRAPNAQTTPPAPTQPGMVQRIWDFFTAPAQPVRTPAPLSSSAAQDAAEIIEFVEIILPALQLLWTDYLGYAPRSTDIQEFLAPLSDPVLSDLVIANVPPDVPFYFPENYIERILNNDRARNLTLDARVNVVDTLNRHNQSTAPYTRPAPAQRQAPPAHPAPTPQPLRVQATHLDQALAQQIAREVQALIDAFDFTRLNNEQDFLQTLVYFGQLRSKYLNHPLLEVIDAFILSYVTQNFDPKARLHLKAMRLQRAVQVARALR
jgi:endonuclease/exonuclease/phosphatase family metal-dependent hydrolase